MSGEYGGSYGGEQDEPVIDPRVSNSDNLASVRTKLAGLEVEVKAGTATEAAAIFEDVWRRRMAEAEDMDAALRGSDPAWR